MNHPATSASALVVVAEGEGRHLTGGQLVEAGASLLTLCAVTP